MAAAKCCLWTVPKLKAELSIKDAVITGRKADLIDRLVAYDRNHNFKPPIIEIREATDIEWPKHGYKQLIADHRLVTYNYHNKLNKSGSPVNSKCECPAGKGPNATCKHVDAVLLMADVFSYTGEISIQKSCTAGLQTFQQPKTYYNGASVKIEKLAKRKPTEIVEDPRPQKYRNMKGFTDHVRNTMINFCSQSSQDLTLRYIFPSS